MCISCSTICKKTITTIVAESDELKSEESEIDVEIEDIIDALHNQHIDNYIDDDEDTYIPTDQELEDEAWGTPIETPRMIREQWESFQEWQDMMIWRYDMEQLAETIPCDQDQD
jgi:hypothetical protein